jgi:hypothetical protein
MALEKLSTQVVSGSNQERQEQATHGANLRLLQLQLSFNSLSSTPGAFKDTVAIIILCELTRAVCSCCCEGHSTTTQWQQVVCASAVYRAACGTCGTCSTYDGSHVS